MPLGVVSIQRAMAGSDAPIKSVGGSRHIAATTARRNTPWSPMLATAA